MPALLFPPVVLQSLGQGNCLTVPRRVAAGQASISRQDGRNTTAATQGRQGRCDWAELIRAARDGPVANHSGTALDTILAYSPSRPS